MNCKIISRAAMLITILVLAFAFTACGSAGSTPDGTAPEGFAVEEGSTIMDDGRFNYTVVIENTTDKTLYSTSICLKALDAEGNEIETNGINPGLFMFGPLFPGEKAAFSIDSEVYEADGSRIWTETPSSFTYSFTDVIKWGDSDVPRITIEDSERVITNGNIYVYDLTLKNNSDKDYDWQKEMEKAQTGDAQDFMIYEVLRDGEGKIIGSTVLAFYEFDQNGSYPVIPAGGEVSGEAAISFNIEEILSQAESRELIITR